MTAENNFKVCSIGYVVGKFDKDSECLPDLVQFVHFSLFLGMPSVKNQFQFGLFSTKSFYDAAN